MFTATSNSLSHGVLQYKLTKSDIPITFKGFIDGLCTSEAFVAFLTDTLQEAPFKAYFWEVPPMTSDRVDHEFEFVLVESELLARIKADKSAFKEYFERDEYVTSFPNLGGDAQLIVPVERKGYSCYGQLADFIRNAPRKQVLPFWQKVGEEYAQSLGPRPKWLSTAGLGIDWLHVRIDLRPKYYRYLPYASMV